MTFVLGVFLILISSVLVGIICAEFDSPIWLTAILGGGAAMAAVHYVMPFLL